MAAETAARRGAHRVPRRAGTAARSRRRLRRPGFLPEGRRLPDDVWTSRHRILTSCMWAQVPALCALSAARGPGLGEGLVESLTLVVPGSLALLPRLSRNLRSASTALGLAVGASILVHLSGGLIEGHFQFFVVLAFLTLYQAWLPFLVALGYVVLEHGIVGALDANAVYDEPAAAHHPWLFAAIHGGFVLAASVGNLLAWRLTEQEALYDSLTRLPNRTYFLDWLTKAMSGRDRSGTAVVFVDLDNFKDANDGFGHEAGDLLLRAIADRLRGIAREGELLARLGGDEFAVVLTGVEDRDAGRAAATRFRSAFSEPFCVSALNLPVSASIGLAFGADDAGSAAELLRDADLAMYEAKRSGRGGISEYQPELHRAALRRTELDSELRAALVAGQFVVHYQPLFSAATGELAATEALVRWNHPTRGMVPPFEFIPAMEQSGLIVALGSLVLRTACRQTAQWQSLRPDRAPLSVSVNLSPRQLGEPALVSTVVQALTESGLEPGLLCLEITESSLIRDFDTTLARLEELRTVGVRLALDDFGTGYSSLSYLKQLPVDSVKIDRSFIGYLEPDSTDARIVHAINELAHALGKTVTAEGVETPQQWEALRAMRVDHGQGYLLGRPVPRETLADLIVDRDGDGDGVAEAAARTLRPTR